MPQGARRPQGPPCPPGPQIKRKPSWLFCPQGAFFRVFFCFGLALGGPCQWGAVPPPAPQMGFPVGVGFRRGPRGVVPLGPEEPPPVFFRGWSNRHAPRPWCDKRKFRLFTRGFWAPPPLSPPRPVPPNPARPLAPGPGAPFPGPPGKAKKPPPPVGWARFSPALKRPPPAFLRHPERRSFLRVCFCPPLGLIFFGPLKGRPAGGPVAMGPGPGSGGDPRPIVGGRPGGPRWPGAGFPRPPPREQPPW